MFERATRLKLRFIGWRGTYAVEDLWDLPLEELDSLFQGLNSKLQGMQGESLLEKKTQTNELLELQISIARHIAKVRINEQMLKETEILKAERKQKLLGVIAEKQDASLKDMSIEDLTKLVNEL